MKMMVKCIPTPDNLRRLETLLEQGYGSFDVSMLNCKRVEKGAIEEFEDSMIVKHIRKPSDQCIQKYGLSAMLSMAKG